MNRRFGLLAVALGLGACFGNPDTIGLPCTEDAACFDGLVCGPQHVCVDPSQIADAGDGDGDTTSSGDGDGDGAPGDGDGDGSPAVCGNGVREGTEACDGMDFGDKTCVDFDFGGGTLACNNCQVDVTGCCLGAGQECSLADSKCCAGLMCGGLVPPTTCM